MRIILATVFVCVAICLCAAAYYVWMNPAISDDQALCTAFCAAFFAPLFAIGAWEQVFPPKE